MRRIDLQELMLHILEMDANPSFISNYQMYLIHNYLLRKNLFSDFGNASVLQMERVYHEDMEVIAEGIKIINVTNLFRELESNLRYSKSDKLKPLISEIWDIVKDK